MSLAHPLPHFTVDQYLAIERGSLERNIYLDGEIFAMAGESDAHGVISANVVGSLVNQLKGSPCQARTKDTKVRSGPIPMSGHSKRGMFSYPDILVISGEPEYHDAIKDVILNPRAILEVLSESTEAFDRGEKFKRYQTQNPSLTDYVLISQTAPAVEHYSRQTDGSWSYLLITGRHSVVEIPSIHCSLKLSDVYDRVTFTQKE